MGHAARAARPETVAEAAPGPLQGPAAEDGQVLQVLVAPAAAGRLSLDGEAGDARVDDGLGHGGRPYARYRLQVPVVAVAAASTA